MTVGDVIWNNLRSEAGVTGQLGHYRRRTWSGADNPKVKKALRSRVVEREFYIRARKGYERLVLVKQYAKLPKSNPLRYSDRPPKRARNGLHPYNVSGYFIRKALNIAPVQPGVPTQLNFATNGVNVTLAPWDSNKEIALLGKLREKVAGTDFNGGVFLGELHQSLNLITDSAYRIANALRAAKRFDFVSATRFLIKGTPREAQAARLKGKSKWTDDLSQNWLQLQYGWLPLLQDVKDAAGFLGHHLNTPMQQSVRVSVSKEGGGSASSLDASEVIRKIVSKNQVWIKAIIRERNPAVLTGIVDPLSVAWELVPYSFVVDWFIPIGSWLQARALNNGIDATYITSRLRTIAVSGLDRVPSNVWYQATQPHLHEAYDFSRVISTNLSVPLPDFKPLAKVASWQHAANAVALLTGPVSRSLESGTKLTDSQRKELAYAVRSTLQDARKNVRPDPKKRIGKDPGVIELS